MKLTSEIGREIRKEYTDVKEKEVCTKMGLHQIKGIRTKVDGCNSEKNVSIKNFKGQSTQVHLTTQKHFIKILGLNKKSKKFLEMFCGNEFLNINGRDRFYIPEIENEYVNDFLNFLNKNKVKVIDLFINNGFKITNVVYKNLKTNLIYDLTYDEIINKVIECTWVTKKGGIHLKNKEGKTFFHIQREGKKNKKNRYNVLCHIHSNLFLID